MAVVSFPKKDLEKLIGKKLSEKDLERIQMLGTPLEKIEDDKLHFEIFPNRPDLLSVEGFSFAVKSFLGLRKGLIKYKTKQSGIKLKVDGSVKNVRPYVVAAVANVKLSDESVASLMQTQEKIHDTFGRKRRKIAIGIHDLDKVKQPFFYKAVKPESIKFIPLDMKEEMNLREICEKHPKGKEYAHIIENAKKWPIIVDSNNEVLSFPPIINSELTRISEHTRNLFIEVTGTNKIAINQALNIIVNSLYLRGFRIGTVDVYDKKKMTTPKLEPRRISIDIDYVNKLLGINLTKSEFIKLIEKMGFGFDGKVLIPAYRVDILHEIDIVEDVAIAYGYDKFKPEIPKISTIGEGIEKNDFSSLLNEIMTGLGFQEVVTMILTNEADEFFKMNLSKGETCETLNPVSTECTICRKKLLPSLLKVLVQNKHRDYPQKIFEIGDCILIDEREDTKTRVIKKLACLIADTKTGYEEISSCLDSLMKNLGIAYKIKARENASFINGRVGEIFINDNKSVGIIGEIHPQVLNNWNLEKPCVAFELDVDKIFEVKR